MRTLRAWFTHPRTVRGCQWAIGVLFIVAALAKLGDLRSFAEQIHNFRLLPLALENLAAMTLPWIELVAGLALVLRVQARAGAWMAALLMVVFTLAVTVALARGLDIACGCFGTADASRVGAVKLLQNVGMTLLALGAAIAPTAPSASASRTAALAERTSQAN